MNTYPELLRNHIFALETNLTSLMRRIPDSNDEANDIGENMRTSLEGLKEKLTDKAFNDAAFDHVMNVPDSYDKNRSGHMTLEEDIELDEEGNPLWSLT